MDKGVNLDGRAATLQQKNRQEESILGNNTVPANGQAIVTFAV
jgi:hypothetical protein